MILFKPEHVQPILDGLKTQTRRAWKKPKALVGKTHLAKTQMLSTEYFAKILIKKVFPQKLGEMSIEECKAELCNTLEEYLDLFWEINKKKLTKKDKKNPNKRIYSREDIHEFPCYAIYFEVVKDQDLCTNAEKSGECGNCDPDGICSFFEDNPMGNSEGCPLGYEDNW